MNLVPLAMDPWPHVYDAHFVHMIVGVLYIRYILKITKYRAVRPWLVAVNSRHRRHRFVYHPRGSSSGRTKRQLSLIHI